MKRYDRSQQVYKTLTQNGVSRIVPVRGLYVSGTHAPVWNIDTCLQVGTRSFTQPTVTDHSNTPDGYTDLEYVEPSTTVMQQFYCPIGGELEYIVDCQFTDPGPRRLMGFYLEANGYFGLNGDGRIAAEWSMSDYVIGSDPSERNVIHAKFQNNQPVEVTVEGFETVAYGYPHAFISDYSQYSTFMMFALPGNGAWCAMKFYRGTFKDLNGNVLYDYVPAKRNSDDNIGVYELVHDVFYPNFT